MASPSSTHHSHSSFRINFRVQHEFQPRVEIVCLSCVGDPHSWWFLLKFNFAWTRGWVLKSIQLSSPMHRLSRIQKFALDRVDVYHMKKSKRIEREWKWCHGAVSFCFPVRFYIFLKFTVMMTRPSDNSRHLKWKLAIKQAFEAFSCFIERWWFFA